MENEQQSVPKSLVCEAITEAFGARCTDVDEDCVVCRVWAEYDELAGRPKPQEAAREA